MATAEKPENADKRTRRFEEKRDRILDAATVLINRHGLKGMTFVGVAEIVGLNTTSVTYYFKRKEQLAAAVLERSIERLEAMVDESARQPSARLRVRHYLELHFRHFAARRQGEEVPLASLSDIRALADPYREALIERYNNLFRSIRNFFGKPRSTREKLRQTAQTHVLAESLFWLPVWLRQYSVGDYERVGNRLWEVLDQGLAPASTPWQPKPLALDANALGSDGEGMPDNFMRVATRLINQLGYRGVSVERIAAELNVTKGSFYHHLEAKDDLVLECFSRSYGRVSLLQRAARDAGGDHWQQLQSTMAALLRDQLRGEDPLLRTTALQALPNEVRGDVLARSDRMARRFAGMLIDGISEGSVRAVDPLIASQVLMCMLNAAFELRNWAARQDLEDAVELYASTVCQGFFRD
ncbi:TetR/AcrR family transcriptional regulator [Parahaliea aestuarii]|uniref:TetR/AcrR family transcriptional regulator n=1 Tax=Parahaliea aestuarii TaxID=1852021 RepID=A0A5C9A3Y0_9GAMM|nr:TetR/AcrR family transcriptional regulator [Parahaliea aestuarii]TXS94480.1 TetR/AcrR family transcriptional regulator [Parahaliea aestuarii]